MKRRLILLATMSLALLLASCSFVRIQNVSDANATVLVRVPDSSQGYTRTVRPGAIIDVFSGHGGRYTITMLPDEQYRQLLEDLRTEVSRRLFEEGASLSADDVSRLVERLNDADNELARLAQPGATCSGYLPDFDTVVVTLAWDFTTNQWALACSSGSG